MYNLGQVSQESQFVLLKGEPGTRKSTVALSYPKPQYWFSIDQKMDALIIPARLWGINPAEIDADDYTDYMALKARLERFRTGCKYKTIVVDSITSNGDVINRQTLALKAGSKNKEGGDKGMMIGGIPVNTMDDYKAEASAFQEEIALLKEIHKAYKVNIVLIAHVIGERKADEVGSSTHFSRIIVTGGKIISAKIPAYCSEVYHFNVERSVDASKEGDYTCLTVHTGDDFARTSLPLERKLVFNNKPLYDTYILPAINKNKLIQPTTT